MLNHQSLELLKSFIEFGFKFNQIVIAGKGNHDIIKLLCLGFTYFGQSWESEFNVILDGFLWDSSLFADVLVKLPHESCLYCISEHHDVYNLVINDRFLYR